MCSPEEGHCDAFLHVLKSQKYDDTLSKNVGWILPIKTRPQCPLAYIMSMLGRLQFPLNERDQFQTGLVFIGAGGTGKSVLQDAVRSMVDDDYHMNLPSNHQMVFGPLQDVETKRQESGLTHLLMCGEELGHMEPNGFKKMIDGGPITCNIKHENRLKQIKVFPNPFFATTNSIPTSLVQSANDGSGAIERRLALVPFTEVPKERDSQLLEKIKAENEFTWYLTTRAYYFQTKYRSKNDFVRRIVPEVMEKRSIMYTKNMNNLFHFIDRSQFTNSEYSCMPIEEFKILYVNYCKKMQRTNAPR